MCAWVFFKMLFWPAFYKKKIFPGTHEWYFKIIAIYIQPYAKAVSL